MNSPTPDYLFKFCKAETAETILTKGTLRWSAPSCFGDPFELNHNSTLNFSPEDLLQAAIQTATAMIFAKEPPRGNAPLLHAIRRWRDEERFASPEEACDVLGELMGQIVTPRQTALQEMMGDWQEYARSVRICSFCDKVDNPTAWYSFADNHRGLAIRFDCSKNQSLSSPKKMQYQRIRPEITSLRDQVSVVLGNSDHQAQDHFEKQLTIKPYYCSNQREWRCFQQISDQNTATENLDLFNNFPIDSQAISAVYFGAFMDSQIKNNLLRLLQEKYPTTKLYQASPASGKFELEFHKL